MYTNVDFIPGGDNPVKGGFGYPLKQGARSEKLEARRGVLRELLLGMAEFVIPRYGVLLNPKG